MNWKLLLVGAAIAALLWAAGWRTSEPEFELTILHTNDVHSHYVAATDSGGAPQGGAARLATMIRQVRRDVPHVLLLDAGDQFQGSLLFTVGGPHVVAEVMNSLGYDAMAIGNHEFDLGPVGLAAFLDEVEFSVLSANTDASANTSLAGAIQPFDVFLFGRDIVGVFGLTTVTTSTASSPGSDIVFEPVARRARTIVEMLERQGVNKIIAVTHIGYAEDLRLATVVDGIDVIVGGHSHTELSSSGGVAPYPTWTTSPQGDPVVVVTDGEWGKTLGCLDLVFDAAGRVIRAEGQPMPVGGSVAEDPAMVTLLEPYVAEASALLGQPVGASEYDLDGDRARVRTLETNLGNVIADAMLRKASGLGARVALMNGGGIRASIPAGPVTMGQILEVLPFANEITTVRLTGRALMAALENGVSQVEAGAGRFLQISGMRIAYDPAAPVGKRLKRVELLESGTGVYRALGAEEEVVVATNDFLAGGGDGFATLAAEGTERYDTGWLLSDALAEYVRESSPLRADVEGRIQAAKSDK